MIGLLDYDFLTSSSTSILIPNLEIMKLAAYYRREHNEFCRLLTLEETELSGYDKIYFFSEQHRNPPIPDHFLTAGNVIFGGTGFTINYKPFDIELIDYTLPRPGIYKDFLKEKYNNGIKSKVIGHVLDDTYYRNYAGKHKLPLPAIKSKKRVILYDKDFFYPDWQETLDKICSRKPASIIRIHPVVCTKVSDYFIIRNNPKFSRTNKIILDLDIPLSEMHYLLKYYTNQFLADITYSSNVYIPLGGNFQSNPFYFRDFIYKLNLLYSFWSKKIKLKIYFKEPDYGYDNPLYNLSKRIMLWSKLSSPSESILDKIPKSGIGKLERAEVELLLKFHPDEKKLLEQNFLDLVQRGYWRV